MRIISFTERWDKLNQPKFTTFRFPRKDKDWYIGEIVQVYYKNRTPNRAFIGIAKIIDKVFKFPDSDQEAQADGFDNVHEMEKWMVKTHGLKKTWDRMNKLTLEWT